MTALSALVATVRRAWIVVVVAVAATAGILLLPTPDNVERRSATGLTDAYDSVQVEQALADLPSSDVDPVIAVFSREDGATLSDADLGAAAEATSALESLASGPIPPPQPSPDATVALVPIPLPAGLNPETEAPDVVGEIRAGLTDLPDGLRAQVTGGPAFDADLAAVFDGANTLLLAGSAIIVAVLLLLIYRSPILLVVPLATVAATEQVVIAVVQIVLPSIGISVDGQITGITAILVFGAATNYALLLISRYREELRVTETATGAMRRAVARTSGAILASGGTVAVAVLTLVLSVAEGNQGLGVATAIGIVLAMISGLVVLPCALVVFGRAAFWPFVPRVGSVGREGALWGAIGSAASRRPTLVAVVGIAGLMALAAPALTLETGLSQNEQFRDTPESVAAAETLAASLPAGATGPAVVITSTDAAEQVADSAAGVPGVVSVEVVETAGDVARLDVVLATESGSEESLETVRDLRDTLPGVASPDEVLIGGAPGEALDVADARERDRALIIPLILALVLTVLIVLLRALVASVLLLAAVVATYFAALGLSWVLFQTVFDYPAVDRDVLLFSFVFLVALGVDYSIFLTTRAREEAAVLGTAAGMLKAVRVTGAVITSAGVLLAAVFAVLGVLPFVTLNQIGIIVCVGVLLDTLVVRTIIVPALAFRLRSGFWWPAKVDPAGPTHDHGQPTPAEPVSV